VASIHEEGARMFQSDLDQQYYDYIRTDNTNIIPDYTPINLKAKGIQRYLQVC
jgi:hypothetical protein